MDKKKLIEAVNKTLEDKGKRKFNQSVEFIINFRSVDFSKSENRLNLDIVLPKGKGVKAPKVAVVGEESVTNEAKKAGAELTILPAEIPSYNSKDKLSMLANQYVMLSQPNQMSAIAKNLGQYLGPRGKLPKPLIGDVKGAIERAKKSVRLVSKGKYLPTAQAFVGTEDMPAQDIADNAEAVYEAIKTKVAEGNIKSIYMKLTMGKPTRIA
ncbi:50S ribosomal protein L1 [Candidatus Micrarchaeota archaeon]|nr:50S ribosomal protein L1 [Candidatus Micrarchaeota archaeon]